MRLRLKEWMELRNVSQAQIAAGLGVSRPTVNAWVEGRPKPDGRRNAVFPDYESLEDLCYFLECTPNDLLEIQQQVSPDRATWRDFQGRRNRNTRLGGNK